MLLLVLQTHKCESCPWTQRAGITPTFMSLKNTLLSCLVADIFVESFYYLGRNGYFVLSAGQASHPKTQSLLHQPPFHALPCPISPKPKDCLGRSQPTYLLPQSHPKTPSSRSCAPLHQPDASHENQLPVKQATGLAQLWLSSSWIQFYKTHLTSKFISYK